MSRRFQFSLRTLLGTMGAVALSLGTAHLTKRFGEFVSAEPIHVGHRLQVKGRLVEFFGPATRNFRLMRTARQHPTA
jgi:hypothetical protein